MVTFVYNSQTKPLYLCGIGSPRPAARLPRMRGVSERGAYVAPPGLAAFRPKPWGSATLHPRLYYVGPPGLVQRVGPPGLVQRVGPPGLQQPLANLGFSGTSPAGALCKCSKSQSLVLLHIITVTPRTASAKVSIFLSTVFP